MADERYPWLDQEAAERLLRGEPVDAVDDHTRAEAEQLARALEEARPAPLARATDTELPGEAAALAAFRKAAAERGQAVLSAAHASHAPPAPQASASAVAELGAVRISQARDARRWGRSLRYGLAAAAAAVAVGGVAVASGTGMLPFTTDGPAPAGSVSAADTPGTISSHSQAPTGSPGPHVDTAPPSPPPAGDSSPPGVSPSPSVTPAPPVTAGSGGGTGESGGAGGTGGKGGTGDTTPEPGTSTDPAGRGGEFSGTKLTRACQDYRTGRIDANVKSRLAKSARTGETLRRFCDRVLGDPARSDGDGDGKGDDSVEGGGGSGGGEDERTGSWGRGDRWDGGRARTRTVVGTVARTVVRTVSRTVSHSTVPPASRTASESLR